MKGKKLTLLCSIGLVLVLVLSTILAACAQEAAPAAPAAPAKPATPSTPSTPAKPATPSTPAKPAPAPEAEVINRKFQTHEAPELINSTMLADWLAPTLEKMSDGRLTMDVFYAAQLVPNEELVDAAVNGVVDAFDISEGYFKGNMPWAYTAGMEPFISRGGTEIFEWTYDWEDGKVFKWQQEQWNPFGIRFMTHVPANGLSVICSKEFDSLADAPELIVRTHSASAIFWEFLGARTLYIPGPEIYTGLQLGTCDCASWKQAASFKDFHWDEVAKYIIQPPYMPYAAHQNYTSLKSWEALPPDLQEIADLAFRWHSFQHYWKYVTKDKTALDAMIAENGVQVIDISSPEEQRMVLAGIQHVLDFVAAQDATAAEYVDMMLDYNRDKGYIE